MSCAPVFASRRSPSCRPCARSRLRSARCSAVRCFGASASPTPKLRHGLAGAGLSDAPRLLDGRSQGPCGGSRSSDAIRCAPQFTNTGPLATLRQQHRLLPLDPGFDLRRIPQRAALQRYGLNLGLQQPRRALDGLVDPAGNGVDLGLDARTAACGRACRPALRPLPRPAWSARSGRPRL